MFMCLRKAGPQADASSMRWESGALPGEFSMHSFGEHPISLYHNGVGESHLSQILEDCPHPKYSLSAKACQGILNRANRRGKKLPEMLERALVEHSLVPSKSEEDVQGGGKGALIQEDKSATLSTLNDQYLFQPVSFHGKAGAEASLCIGLDVAASLVTSKELMVAHSVENHPADGRVGIDATGKGLNLIIRAIGINGDIAGTLDASYFKGCGERQGTEREVVCVKHIVRRLTTLECERLQGFPDGWTDIGDWTDTKGKVRKTSDSARYKALGNSIALPPWKWVIKRLCACYERDATMASLFDGIGGFPYIWEQINGKGSCLWASEIEEFPIAVTKERIR
jgi:DNA (cytosine-5)-methyltransferase 1